MDLNTEMRAYLYPSKVISSAHIFPTVMAEKPQNLYKPWSIFMEYLTMKDIYFPNVFFTILYAPTSWKLIPLQILHSVFFCFVFVFQYLFTISEYTAIKWCVCMCAHTYILYTHISKGAQIQGARFPRQLNFVQWHLIFVGAQYGTCFTSPFWHLEFWGGS